MVCGEAACGDFEPVNLWRLVSAVMFPALLTSSEVNRESQHCLAHRVVANRRRVMPSRVNRVSIKLNISGYSERANRGKRNRGC